MPELVPNVWINHMAEEAAHFYLSVFPDSRIVRVGRYSELGPGEPGSVAWIELDLGGTSLVIINGQGEFEPTPGVSLLIPCETQEEIDHYWSKLAEGGQEMQCGWLTDRFGVTWQVAPRMFDDLMADPHSPASQRAWAAMMQMTKIDIATIQRAIDDADEA
ncbi:MAG: VOC family protein [Acidimicrobiales bacterium]|nr:MAG: VOC family protein [Acidimicrobiales bacterium]